MLHLYDVFEDSKHNVFQIRNFNEVLTVEFSGDKERKIFLEILKESNSQGENLKIENLISALNKKYDKSKVLTVINQLKEYELISEQDIKEQFEENIILWGSSKRSNPKFENFKVGLLGSGQLLDFLEDKCEKSGYKQIQKQELKEGLTLTDFERIISDNDFIIYDSDKWNPRYLEQVNQLAFSLNKPWILIRGCSGTTGSIGPLFYGKETACYNCLMGRIKSNMEFLPYFEEYEKYLIKTKQSAKSEGGFTLLYEMLAATAVFEMTKFALDFAVPEIYGAYLTVDMFTYQFTKHTALKSPKCSVCKPSVDYDLAPWLEPILLQ